MRNTAREQLSRKVITRYAAGSLATGGFSTLPGLVLVYYLTDTLGVVALAAGFMITMAKVWDVVIDPVIGGLSDRVLKEKGSRRGPMTAGVIGLPLSFLATFAVPAGLSPFWSGTWVFVAFLLAATCFSLFQVPYIALPAELTSKYVVRTRLISWRVVVLTFSILLFGGGGPEIRGMFGSLYLGYFMMGAVSAILFFAGTLIAVTIVPKDQPTSPAPREPIVSYYRGGYLAFKDSQPFRALLTTFVIQALTTGLMLAGAQYVARWILHDEGAVTILFVCLIGPALLFAPVWKKVADRIGKERAFAFSSITFLPATLCLVPLVFCPGYWIVAPVAVAGSAYAGMQTLPIAILPDVIAVDSRRGVDRAGIFGGVWTAGETTGMALGTTVLTIVMALTGYIESTLLDTVVQPDSAITGIALTFSLLPAILMIISLVTLTRYRLRQEDIDRDA